MHNENTRKQHMTIKFESASQARAAFYGGHVKDEIGYQTIRKDYVVVKLEGGTRQVSKKYKRHIIRVLAELRLSIINAILLGGTLNFTTSNILNLKIVTQHILLVFDILILDFCSFRTT